MEPADLEARVRRVLSEARDLGFLGPGPISPHIDHARGYVDAVRASGLRGDPDTFLDLGSGGGLPGLVLASEWPDARGVLLDAGERRAEFLRHAVDECGLDGRIEVVEGRAEQTGHDPAWRAGFDVVAARSFGRPAVTAECAAGFLRVGGVLVVSEPPARTAAERWPDGPLTALGMSAADQVRGRFGYRVVAQETLCPERFPRRVGVPAKRPLF